jgi:hypothetical protein
MKNNHRPPPARTHKPRSKLIPSSATKSTRLAAADPSLTTEAGHPHLANSATAPSSPVHQYFKIPRIPRVYTTHSQFGQRRTHVALPLLALIHTPRKKLPSLNGCRQVGTRPFWIIL